ncbi:MAG: Ig-like domain-containing protein, partial [Bacillota bacterium]|nr:Ig-like domain-containing protein [Bacillota bacterium]
MYAWLDKGQNSINLPYVNGYTSDPNVDVRYFFVVSINDGPFVSVPYAEAASNNLKDSNENIDAAKGLSAFGSANRNVTDPDGTTNQWVYPLSFTLKPGTKYTFAYLRGFVANNGMSLILSKDTTADGKEGYIGVIQGQKNLTTAEQDQWVAHKNDMYQFAKKVTLLKTESGETIVGDTTKLPLNSVEFADFYHTCQTYADLTALNAKIDEAETFAGGVTDNDYKLGTYRKTSVQALNTLIAEINAKTTLNEELQTSVDAQTEDLNKALNYAKEPAILVKGVTLDKNRADIIVGDTLTLKASVSPENADDPTITWTSSNDKVASVKNGVVKAVSAGNVTITATTVDGGYTATCAIEVKNINKSVTNTNNSVGVNYNTSALPTGISVSSVKNIVITSGTDKTSIEKALSNIGYTNLLINDVQLLDLDGSPITSLSGNVTVKIKIPTGAANEDLSVFWYNTATGKLTNMNATKQNGYLLFNTNHFSYYVVAKAAKTSSSTLPQTGSPLDLLTIMLIGMSFLGTGLFLTLKTTKRNKI